MKKKITIVSVVNVWTGVNRMSNKFVELEFQDDYVRYVMIPTIVIEADDNILHIAIEWLKWSFGFAIVREWREL